MLICDCINKYCEHFNTYINEKNYKLIHSETKAGEAFRNALLNKNNTKIKTEDKETNILISGLKFLIALLKFANSGFIEVSKTTRTARLSVCAMCEYNKKWKCTKCTCNLELKSKWSTEQCPIGRWDRIPLQMAEGEKTGHSPCCGS